MTQKTRDYVKMEQRLREAEAMDLERCKEIAELEAEVAHQRGLKIAIRGELARLRERLSVTIKQKDSAWELAHKNAALCDEARAAARYFSQFADADAWRADKQRWPWLEDSDE